MKNTLLKIQVGVRLPGPDFVIVEALATAEKRSLSGMIAVLVSEAINERASAADNADIPRGFTVRAKP